MDTVEPAVLARRAEHGACERHYGAKPFAGPNRALREGGAPQRNRPRRSVLMRDASPGPFSGRLQAGDRRAPGQDRKMCRKYSEFRVRGLFPGPVNS